MSEFNVEESEVVEMGAAGEETKQVAPAFVHLDSIYGWGRAGG